MENPSKMDDLGVPLFLETSTSKWWLFNRNLLFSGDLLKRGKAVSFREGICLLKSLFFSDFSRLEDLWEVE